MPAPAATTSLRPSAPASGAPVSPACCTRRRPPLADYVGVVEAAGLYPGSPAIARALLRPGDQLLCCELHPEDAASLRRHFAGDRQVAVHARDGWTALGALLPPAAKRGLVLIDPPYEASGEHERVAAAIGLVARRFPAAAAMAWYPIKHRAPVRALHEAIRLAAVPDVVAAELWLREPTDPARLNGNGLLVRKPAVSVARRVVRLAGGPAGAVEPGRARGRLAARAIDGGGGVSFC